MVRLVVMMTEVGQKFGLDDLDLMVSTELNFMQRNVPQTSPSDTQIRHYMHGMRCMHVDFS